MKPDQDFLSLMHQAHAMRHQYIGGLLHSAWNAARKLIRFGGQDLTRRIVGNARQVQR